MSEFKHPEPEDAAIIIRTIGDPDKFIGRMVLVERYCTSDDFFGRTARNSRGVVSRVNPSLRLVVVTGIEDLLIPIGFCPGTDIAVWPREWLMKLNPDQDVESEREQKLKEYGA